MAILTVLGFVSVFVLAYGFGTQKSLDNQSKAVLRDDGFTGTSDDWSNGGTTWVRNKLPDFSYAGFLNSTLGPSLEEGVTPTLPVVVNLSGFKDKNGQTVSANGTDTIDDTAVFKKAIEVAENGAIFIPKGTYYLSDRLMIEKSNLELRGESRAETILIFTKPLNDLMRHYYADVIDPERKENLSVPSMPCYLVNGRGYARGDVRRDADPNNDRLTSGYRMLAPTDPYILKLRERLSAGLITSEQYEEFVTDACGVSENITNSMGLIWFGPPLSLELPPDQRYERVQRKFNPDPTKNTDANRIVPITETAERGTYSVKIADKKSLMPGDYVAVRTSITPTDNMASNLSRYLPIFRELYGYSSTVTNPEWRNWSGNIPYDPYFGQAAGGVGGKWSGVDVPMHIKSIENNVVTFYEPLPFKVQSDWQPRLTKIDPQVRNGVRNMTIRMNPTAPSALHIEESGYNAITMRVLVNSWIKDVTIENSDLGINMGVFSADNTIKNIKLTTVRPPVAYNLVPRCEAPDPPYSEDPNVPDPERFTVAWGAKCCWADEVSPISNPTRCKVAAGSNTPESDVGLRDKPFSGHYGISIGFNATRILVQNVEFKQSFGHDLSVSGAASRNVFADIWTDNDKKLIFDHHGDKPYENLFTNIDVGDMAHLARPVGPLTTIPYTGSGADERMGPKAGVRTTFWNIYTNNGSPLPEPSNIRQMNPIWTIRYLQGLPLAEDWRSTKPTLDTVTRTASIFPLYNYEANVNPKNLFNDQLKYRKSRQNTVHSTYQCLGINGYKGTSILDSDKLYSTSNVAITQQITLRGAARYTTAKKLGVIEFCWAPYWDSAKNTYADWRDGGNYFHCRPAASYEQLTETDFKGSLTISPQQMIDALPAVGKAVANASTDKKLVVMIRMSNPNDSAQKCSANPGVNFGFGNEFKNGGTNETSTCGSSWDGTPCFQVIGYDVAGTPTPLPPPPPPPRPATQAEINFTKQIYSQLTGSNTPTGASNYQDNLNLVITNNCKAAVKGVMWEPAFMSRRSSYSNADYIRMLFRAFVSREPTAGELAGWNTYLTNRTYDRVTMVDGLYNSSVVQNVCLTRQLYVAPPPGIVPAHEQLTRQLYTQLVGTVPAPSDTAYKANADLVLGKNCKAAVKNIMTLPAFRIPKTSLSNSEYVGMMYRAILSRDPDANGLTSWTNNLANNSTTRDSIVDKFYSYPEAKAVCDTRKLYVPPVHEQLTRQFYTQLVGTVPAPFDTVYRANVASVLSNKCKEAVKNIMTLPAFATRKTSYSNSQYVTMMYKAILSRDPDASGLTSWTNNLANNSTTRDSIVDKFYSYPEANTVCSSRKLYPN